MTWETLAQSGRGILVLFARVAGLPYVYASADFTPSDSWYSAAGHLGVKPWLRWRGVTLRERAAFQDGILRVDPISLELVDVNGELTDLMMSWRAQHVTVLTATLTDTATTINVDSTSGFATSGVIWIDREAVHYTGKTASSFTGCSRGYYGSQAVEHEVDTDASPAPIQPSVLDGPQFLAGKRCDLYAGTVEGGVLSTTTCIFRGYIEQDVEAGRGTWRLSVAHISQLLTRKVLLRPPRTKILPGHYFAGGPAGSLSTIRIYHRDTSTGSTKHADVTIPEGYYGRDELASVWNEQARAAYAAAGFIRKGPFIRLAGDTYQFIDEASSTTYSLYWAVEEGTLPWCLGFARSAYYLMPADGARGEIDAEDDPRLWTMELASPAAVSVDPFVEVEDSNGFVEDVRAFIPGQPHLLTKTVATGKLTFYRGLQDYLPPRPRFLLIEDESKLTISQGFFFMHGLREALQTLLHLDASQPEPASWCIEGITSDDVDWDELDDALAGVEWALTRMLGAIIKPTRIDKYILSLIHI